MDTRHQQHSLDELGDKPSAAQAALKALESLEALVVKDGVMLGGLSEPQRALALGLVWAGLPQAPLSERAVNEALKAQLAGAARCLDTDHVELRRWLCDTGWLSRDGYGREYRRVAAVALPAALAGLGASLAQAFEGGATVAFTDRVRRQRAAARDARRRAFEARACGAPGASA